MTNSATDPLSSSGWPATSDRSAAELVRMGSQSIDRQTVATGSEGYGHERNFLVRRGNEPADRGEPASLERLHGSSRLAEDGCDLVHRQIADHPQHEHVTLIGLELCQHCVDPLGAELDDRL